ncbi:hypothetical protein N658DRAFT_165435 [Parathielavia hyrcaniae]|uniref:Uncharacterized protein n=1 Tax=Parathielavia hyrcaniae TaxID=113614 RepID=A0AAN6SZF7_9PEZI|nr:hypothetical protein N658DRAFT_165435 [Parathielavia hyrcaniae]
MVFSVTEERSSILGSTTRHLECIHFGSGYLRLSWPAWLGMSILACFGFRSSASSGCWRGLRVWEDLMSSNCTLAVTHPAAVTSRDSLVSAKGDFFDLNCCWPAISVSISPRSSCPSTRLPLATASSQLPQKLDSSPTLPLELSQETVTRAGTESLEF